VCHSAIIVGSISCLLLDTRPQIARKKRSEQVTSAVIQDSESYASMEFQVSTMLASRTMQSYTVAKEEESIITPHPPIWQFALRFLAIDP
jgi:hypothetical protein